MTSNMDEVLASLMSADESKAKRSNASKKANARKVVQFGPDELSRASKQAGWTTAHPDADKAANEFLREKVYSVASMEQARRFDIWQQANLIRPYDENPYAWSGTKLTETI